MTADRLWVRAAAWVRGERWRAVDTTPILSDDIHVDITPNRGSAVITAKRGRALITASESHAFITGNGAAASVTIHTFKAEIS